MITWFKIEGKANERWRHALYQGRPSHFESLDRAIAVLRTSQEYREGEFRIVRVEEYVVTDGDGGVV